MSSVSRAMFIIINKVYEFCFIIFSQETFFWCGVVEIGIFYIILILMTKSEIKFFFLGGLIVS